MKKDKKTKKKIVKKAKTFKDFAKQFSSKGGKTVAKRGPEYMSMIGKRGAEKRWKNKTQEDSKKK